MQILGTERVLIQVVLGRQGIAVLGHAAFLTIREQHVTTATRPSEGTDAQTLDRHYPDAADDVLAVVLVRFVHTLTVINAYLIVEQTASVSVGEQVTGNLHTDVTATRGTLTSTVAEARQVVDDVGIGAPALRDGVGGILEGEGTFELSGTHLELRVFAPLCVEVYQLYGRLSRTCGVGALNLGTPVEVTDFSIQDETGQTQFERV